MDRSTEPDALGMGPYLPISGKWVILADVGYDINERDRDHGL